VKAKPKPDRRWIWCGWEELSVKRVKWMRVTTESERRVECEESETNQGDDRVWENS